MQQLLHRRLWRCYWQIVNTSARQNGRKLLWGIVESLLDKSLRIVVILIDMTSIFFGCFRHDSCCSEICVKITRFWQKEPSHDNELDYYMTFTTIHFVQTSDNSWRHLYMASAHTYFVCPLFLGKNQHKIWLLAIFFYLGDDKAFDE